MASHSVTNPSRELKFLNDLSSAEKSEFLNSFDLVFCDCDGVLWYNLFDAIPGSADAIRYLRKMEKKVIFVTNNSLFSTENQLRKFASCNIHVEEHDLIHPAKTISDHLKSLQFNGLIMCFSSRTFKEHLRENGFQVAAERERLIDGSIKDLHDAIYSKEPIEAVIIDVDFNLTAWKLMRAQIYLKNPNCLFLAGAADPHIPFGGHFILGPGPFIQIVEEATQRKASVFGKPGKALSDLLKAKYNIKDARRVLMIGDNLKSDIEFGKSCGFQTLLVLSGGVDCKEVTAIEDEKQKPDFVLRQLGDLDNLI